MAFSKYQICNRCIMDTSDKNIVFNSKRECNHCTEYFRVVEQIQLSDEQKSKELDSIIKKIKNSKKDRDFDCILGMSGGLDSSYVLYVAKKFGLKPLAVHVDNGWNSELAVNNIENLCKKLDTDLYTYVIDWEEFRDLQLAFFKAHVVDIEMLTDQALSAVLYEVANRYNVKYIIAGTNMASEGMMMPEGWCHAKKDVPNIRDIHKKFGSLTKIKTYPFMELHDFLIYKFIKQVHWISLLDYIPDYRRDTAIHVLEKEVGWRAYEKKHYESIFTRFYQGYILPQKFHVDKRKVHYSNLICSGQMSREDALKLMEHESYEDENQLKSDFDYVLKKLDFSESEFQAYMAAPPIPHNFYASNEKIITTLKDIQKILLRFSKLMRR